MQPYGSNFVYDLTPVEEIEVMSLRRQRYMRSIDREQWENKWRPKIEVAMSIIAEKPRTELEQASLACISSVLKMADEEECMRANAISIVRHISRGLPRSEQLKYVLSGRSSIPYQVKEVITHVCEQIEQEAGKAFRDSELISTLTYTTTHYHEWDKGYNISTRKVGSIEPTHHTTAALKVARHWERKLKAWYKAGQWDGIMDTLYDRDLMSMKLMESD